MPSKTRHVTQTLSGAYIGTTLTAEYVRTLPQLIFPVLIMLVGVFVWCFLVGFIIHKLTKLEFDLTGGFVADAKVVGRRLSGTAAAYAGDEIHAGERSLI